jgi:hypothetical protein
MAMLTETLAGIRRGKFLSICDEQLTELLKKIAELGDGGEITVSLKFEFKTDGQLVCKPKLKIKGPMPESGDAIFYVTPEGDLDRTDPKQGDFDDAWNKTKDRN